MDYLKNRDLDWHSEVRALTHILDNHPFLNLHVWKELLTSEGFCKGFLLWLEGSLMMSMRGKKSQFQATKKDVEKDLPAAARVSRKGQCCHQTVPPFPVPLFRDSSAWAVALKTVKTSRQVTAHAFYMCKFTLLSLKHQLGMTTIRKYFTCHNWEGRRKSGLD